MKAIITAIQETITTKRKEIGYMVEERKRLDERIISELMKADELERELRYLNDNIDNREKELNKMKGVADCGPLMKTYSAMKD